MGETPELNLTPTPLTPIFATGGWPLARSAVVPVSVTVVAGMQGFRAGWSLQVL